MAIQTRLIEYKHGDVLLEGFLAWDDTVSGPQPAVAIAHAWRGRTEPECDKAIKLAEQGYVGFALDMYGKASLGANMDECRVLMGDLRADRAVLQERIAIAIDTLSQQAEVNAKKIAAIGYCFGGLCVLDLARTGTKAVKGVVSFHGIFTPPDNIQGKKIKAKVLCLHGYDDPLAQPETILELGKEMTEAGADWQLHAYGNTVHSFTDPSANKPEMGSMYSPAAFARSWTAMKNFIAEVLG